MSTYTLTTLTLCFISVIVAAYMSKSKGTLMEYMVFVMSFSMSIGLSIGFYFGVIFKGDLLYSTLLSILISIIIGFLVGIRFHLYSALEGMLSGLMSGMMGAMITEMLNAEQAHNILLISILFTITITTSCILQFLSHTFSSYIHHRFLLLLSVSIGILFTVFISFPDYTSLNSRQHNQHIHEQ